MGPVSFFRALFRAVRGPSEPPRELRVAMPVGPDADALWAVVMRVLEESGAVLAPEDTEDYRRLRAEGENSADAAAALRAALRDRPVPEGSYFQLIPRHEGQDDARQWLGASPLYVQAHGAAQGQDGPRDEAVAALLEAFRGVTFPGMEHLKPGSAEEHDMMRAVLAERPWIELDTSVQPIYLPESGRSQVIQPYLPALLLPPLMHNEVPDPRLRGLALSILDDPSLLAQLTAEQCEAAAKACVVIGAMHAEPDELDPWLYLCAVKHEGLHITRRTAFSSNIENLMNLHIASALQVEKASETARLSALWIQAARWLDQRATGITEDDMHELVRRADEGLSQVPIWLQSQVDFLIRVRKEAPPFAEPG